MDAYLILYDSVGKEHDWNKIKDQWSQDKDFLRETWNIALDDEDKFKLILLHAENLFQVRIFAYTLKLPRLCFDTQTFLNCLF